MSVFFEPLPSALLSVAEMRRAEAAAMAGGLSSERMMEAAGGAVSAAITVRWSRRPVAVLCGPGNNGGDGFVVARMLRAAGWDVRVGLLGDVSALSSDAALNAARWEGEVEAAEPALLDGVGLVVDGLFGTGLSRPIEGAAAVLIRAVKRSGAPCVAIDIPSGVDGDSGAVLGSATECALSVTFCRRKPGHLLYPGRALCGEVLVANIGIPNELLDHMDLRFAANEPGLWAADFPWPLPEAHKHARGHALIVGGARMTGAARLAARAARRVGAGLVTLACPPEVWALYAADMPGNLVAPVADRKGFDEVLKAARHDALLLGPGAGVSDNTRSLVRAALASQRPCVLDADALTSFAGQTDRLFALLGSNCLLTPHEGEFTRLFAQEDMGIAGGKLGRAVVAAQRTHAIVLLKGADTVIAAPDGRAVINSNGPPDLATAGSGDVLAGLCVGLMAQGMAPFSAAAAAAWLHGAAAQAFGAGLIAEDLCDMLPRVLTQLKAASR